MSRCLIAVVAFTAVAFVPVCQAAWCNPLEPKTLPQFEDWVANWFSEVPQGRPEDLVRASHPPLLLDVRELAEFAVSHLAGAIQVDPDASLAEVRSLIGPNRRGEPVLFYCSVGFRSSRLAQRVQAGLLADGATEVASLRGGIFAWANANRPMVNAEGTTNAVHPYDDCRARLLKPAVPTVKRR